MLVRIRVGCLRTPNQPTFPSETLRRKFPGIGGKSCLFSVFCCGKIAQRLLVDFCQVFDFDEFDCSPARFDLAD
jgi:hypothetical protein